MKIKLFILKWSFLVLFFGCNSDNKTEERLKRLEQENKELKEKISTEKLYIPQNNQNTSPNNNTDNQSRASKYVFVLLKTTQTEYNETSMERVDRRYNICSEIERLAYVDEDMKYSLMDQVQGSYMKSASRIMDRGRVNSREVFVFDTYEEASKAREKYLVGR